MEHDFHNWLYLLNSTIHWCNTWDEVSLTVVLTFCSELSLSSYSTRYPHTLRQIYAAVNGHLELPLLKDRQRFDAISTSNLEVYKFRDWWILTYFIFGHGESSPNNIWSMVNLERTCVSLFYYFLCLKVNLDLEKTNQLGESSSNFIFAVVNLDPIILEKRWIDVNPDLTILLKRWTEVKTWGG